MPCCSFDHLGRIIIKYLLNKKFHETCTGTVLVCIISVQGIQIQAAFCHIMICMKIRGDLLYFPRNESFLVGTLQVKWRVGFVGFSWSHFVASGAAQLELLEEPHQFPQQVVPPAGPS